MDSLNDNSTFAFLLLCLFLRLSGNDFLKNAARRRTLKKKSE